MKVREFSKHIAKGKAIPTKRISAGFYQGVFMGVHFSVSSCYYDYLEQTLWGYSVNGGKCHDLTHTKKNAVLNAMDEIKESKINNNHE